MMEKNRRKKPEEIQPEEMKIRLNKFN